MPLHPSPPSSRGLAARMRRVIEECDRAAEGFQPDPVHDLRVALRRCRSIAASLEEIDPDPGWRRLRRISRPLFRTLGTLRDVQVMADWIPRLAPPGDPVGARLLLLFGSREQALKSEAEKALGAFPRERWERLGIRLSRRLTKLPQGVGAFESLALEAWEEARAAHRAALRRRSRIGWHQLRIAGKRFRYVVENFLPIRYAEWEEGLKQVQDLLGEVHDLDVLAVEVHRLRAGVGPEAIRGWLATIERDRRGRIAAYRSCAGGKASLWARWRSQLPAGGRLWSTSTARLAATAALLDPDFRRTRRVARLARDLLDGLAALELDAALPDAGSRRCLDGAALLHAVGRSLRGRGYHKFSGRLVRRLKPPPGWSGLDMEILALVIRYHRGAEPGEGARRLSVLDEADRRRVLLLSGVLRLACALSDSAEPAALHPEAALLGDVVQVRVSGWPDTAAAAARAARGKHLLEQATGRSILVRARPAS